MPAGIAAGVSELKSRLLGCYFFYFQACIPWIPVYKGTIPHNIYKDENLCLMVQLFFSN